jgi:hypothetical protein
MLRPSSPSRACQQREQPCTFDLPPTTRVRKPTSNATGSTETQNRSDRSPVASNSHGYSSRDGSQASRAEPKSICKAKDRLHQTNGDSPIALQTTSHAPPMAAPVIANMPPNVSARPQLPQSLFFQGNPGRNPGPLHPPQAFNHNSKLKSFARQIPTHVLEQTFHLPRGRALFTVLSASFDRISLPTIRNTFRTIIQRDPSSRCTPNMTRSHHWTQE